MKPTISAHYSGNLRCELQHNSSKSIISTDAPKDNKGKGERFSPTDLLAASLGSCMLTIIAIRAAEKNIEIGNPSFSIAKVMNLKPRKVKLIKVEIEFQVPLNKKEREYLETEAKSCPVALSLSKETEQQIIFTYS